MVPFFAPPCMYSVHASSSQLERPKSFEVDWSRHVVVKSSRVGCAQVDRRRLGVILASSRVRFLYLSDSQVYGHYVGLCKY